MTNIVSKGAVIIPPPPDAQSTEPTTISIETYVTKRADPSVISSCRFRIVSRTISNVKGESADGHSGRLL